MKETHVALQGENKLVEVVNQYAELGHDAFRRRECPIRVAGQDGRFEVHQQIAEYGDGGQRQYQEIQADQAPPGAPVSPEAEQHDLRQQGEHGQQHPVLLAEHCQRQEQQEGECDQ